MPNFIGFRAVKCPVCKQATGKPCKGRFFSKMTPHMERVDLEIRTRRELKL